MTIESVRIAKELDKQARRDREYLPGEYSASVMATKEEIEAEEKRKAEKLTPMVSVPLKVLEEIRERAERCEPYSDAKQIINAVNKAIRGDK